MQENEHQHPGRKSESLDEGTGRIQRLQKKVLRGQELNPKETEYLAAHATSGVKGYLKRKLPLADHDKIILAYAADVLEIKELTEKMVTGICFEIQFDFERFKEWVIANRRKFTM